MKQKTFWLLVFLSLTLAACSSAPTPTPAMTVIVEPGNPSTPASLPKAEADVPRVSVERARIAFDAGMAVIVDVRSAESFAVKHIVGSLSIPLARIEKNPNSISLDKNQWIITYCT